jgi:Flp pilus assembly pilin Flp
VSQPVRNSFPLSHGDSVISGRRAVDDAHERAKEVNSLQNVSQKLYARLVTTFTAEDGQTMAEYGIVLALITLAVVVTLTSIGIAVNGKLTGVLDVLSPKAAPAP